MLTKFICETQVFNFITGSDVKKISCFIIGGLLLCSGVQADEFRQSEPKNFVVRDDLILVPKDSVSNQSAVAELGDFSVVGKKSSQLKGTSRVQALTKPSESNGQLFVIENIETKLFGTANGGIIVYARNKEDLEAIIETAALEVRHRFGSVPAVILFSQDPKNWNSVLKALRGDLRVIAAELDTNFYERKPK
jgi:hypothetical protein